MHHSSTQRIVTAGDVAPGTFVSWMWDPKTGLWMDTTNRNPFGGAWPSSKYILRGVDIRVSTTAGAFKSGVKVYFMIVSDPAHPEIVRILKEGFQGPLQLMHWTGRETMDGGILYRIHREGLIATDVVDFAISYEGTYE